MFFMSLPCFKRCNVPVTYDMNVYKQSVQINDDISINLDMQQGMFYNREKIYSPFPTSHQ
jgi:hypothetical protein